MPELYRRRAVTGGGSRATAESVALLGMVRPDRAHAVDHWASLTAALNDADVAYGTAFVAPFGRRELRELLERVSGEGSGDLLDRVMTVVGKEGLPRNPFVLSALVAVLSEQADPSSLNESGVLGGYVDLLLADEALVDLERLGMDKRRREHLLARLAVRPTDAEGAKLPRLDAEQLPGAVLPRAGVADGIPRTGDRQPDPEANPRDGG
jgi:hypothetical protein